MRSKTGIFGLLVILSLSVCPFSRAFAEEAYDAYGYLEMLAETSGVTTDDFVPTLSGAVAVAAGMSIANTAGINYGMAASESLSHLVEAADYPAWDTLSSTSQNSWGTKENYEAAKFNALMSAFGMGEEVERWKSFDSSGGAKFTFGETAQSTLRKLGDIGTRWAQGLPNTVNDVYETLTNRSFLANYFPPQTFSYTKTDEDTGWPSNVSSPVNYVMGNSFTCTYNGRQNYGKSDSVVNMFYAATTNNGAVVWFTTSPFKAYIYNSSDAVPTVSADSYTVNGISFYMLTYGTKWSSISLPVNTYTGSPDWKQVVACILGGNSEEHGGVPEIEDYPEDIQAEANVDTYYPEDGIVKDIGWPEFLVVRQPVIPETGDLAQVIALLKRISTDIGLLDRTSEDLTDLENAVNRFQFYANGILKVHDEGLFDSITDIGTDISEIVSILQNWHTEDNASQIIGDFDFPEYKTKAETLEETLDDILPFGAIFLVSGLVGSIADINVISEPKIEIPWNFFPDHEEQIVIDVSWIEDGRNMIHAFMIFTLLLSLTMLTIGFVKNEV